MKQMKRKWLTCLAIGALAWGHGSCSAMLENSAKKVTPAVVSGAVEGLADPETQRQMLEAIDEGRVKEMSARMSAGFMDGVLETLEAPARRQRLEAILSGLATNVTTSAVDAMLDSALDEKVQARLRLAMRDSVTDLITAMVETLDRETGSSSERNKVLGEVAHEVTKQATLGFQDALDETKRERATGEISKKDGALVIAANNATSIGKKFLWTLGVGLSAIVLALAMTVIWAIRKNRLRKNELAQRDSTLLLLTETLKSTSTRPWAGELLSVLETSTREHEAGKHIRKALGIDEPQ